MQPAHRHPFCVVSSALCFLYCSLVDLFSIFCGERPFVDCVPLSVCLLSVLRMTGAVATQMITDGVAQQLAREEQQRQQLVSDETTKTNTAMMKNRNKNRATEKRAGVKEITRRKREVPMRRTMTAARSCKRRAGIEPQSEKRLWRRRASPLQQPQPRKPLRRASSRSKQAQRSTSRKVRRTKMSTRTVRRSH